MKRFVCIISVLSVLAGLSSCNSGSTVSHSTGMPFEVVVVMDNELWNGTTGSAVKEELTSPVPYLPQPESSMRISYCMPSQFNGLFKYVRNILIVDVDKTKYTKVSLHNENDKWAHDQLVLYLTAPDAKMIEDYLIENNRVLVDYYTKIEMHRMASQLKEKYSTIVYNMSKEKFGIEIFAPVDIVSYKDAQDCLWFSNDAIRGRTDLLIYSFPFTDDSTFTLNYLVHKRDSVAKATIPGSFEGTYMSTEKRVVDYYAKTLNGEYCGVLRGLWRMEGGDMMGGPFVSYARVDKVNHRVIVTEGFVFEPDREKKNYIRRIEAALNTVLLPGETQ